MAWNIYLVNDNYFQQLTSSDCNTDYALNIAHVEEFLRASQP